MKQLALQLGGYDVGKFPGLNDNLRNATLGSALSQVLNIVFVVAGFLMFFWAFWGVFEYIFAGGNKEGLGKARAKITWAIVGFIILSLAFAISQYIEQLFPAK
ncbi:MAG: hypothetical protein UU73_C0002G0095 [Candidatus Daviesbacteria bacterium GW2011_GWA1_41_61]|uniref:Uncharacterized protein n=1 Tax=Candidatus Daviesbacteria bacterium GW2011_GWA2_40_9 TaxID=1618424 RepID=A0A0G0U0Z1_9BACT|nr:MAG: hypothetical protein UU26_C0010G0017 [Candidatus Daviesbacteria bacterium GW2011_GWC1_40_9]KKR82779.1 MAG: hypothetical protein UU29_C0009G0050 [Candidatus Daviesbacteria bacterium GW2011_GWA2_40_9]KKR93755.1 MAG: hypothetical protein UU44_C0001G0095 [Candidatus Daviesbacteria bacterium GW2011_GWB1_41_15]KKS15221.1 MAG: hypothetical protein UU73_C0002G0095 [Candidatus Daviesbacteria bacterium GW2011_GWA1_41_61]